MDSRYINYDSTLKLTRSLKEKFCRYRAKHNEPEMVKRVYIDSEKRLRTDDIIENDFLDYILTVIFPFCSHNKFEGTLTYIDVKTHNICKFMIVGNRLFSTIGTVQTDGEYTWSKPQKIPAPPTYEKVLTAHDKIVGAFDTTKKNWVVRIWVTHKPFTAKEMEVKVTLEESPIRGFQEKIKELGRLPLNFSYSDLVKVLGDVHILWTTADRIWDKFMDPDYFKQHPQLSFLKQRFHKSWAKAEIILKEKGLL